jgi:hypothetical protein
MDKNEAAVSLLTALGYYGKKSTPAGDMKAKAIMDAAIAPLDSLPASWNELHGAVMKEGIPDSILVTVPIEISQIQGIPYPNLN